MTLTSKYLSSCSSLFGPDNAQYGTIGFCSQSVKGWQSSLFFGNEICGIEFKTLLKSEPPFKLIICFLKLAEKW